MGSSTTVLELQDLATAAPLLAAEDVHEERPREYPHTRLCPSVPDPTMQTKPCSTRVGKLGLRGTMKRLVPTQSICAALLAILWSPDPHAWALEPEDSATTVHGFVLGPRAHPSGLLGEYIADDGTHLSGGRCLWVDADGAVIQVQATNVPGVSSGLVLGPPSSSPQVVGRDATTITLAWATCETSLPVIATFDVSGPEFAGLTWKDFSRFARFDDGTVLFPVTVDGVGSMQLVALDPTDGSATILVDLDTMEGIYTSEPYAFEGMTTGPDDRVYALLSGNSASGQTRGLVAISRDGLVDPVLPAEDWGSIRLAAGLTPPTVFYFAPLDAIAVGPVEPQIAAWYQQPLLALFPLAAPELGAAPRPPWLRMDDVVWAENGGVTRAGQGLFKGLVRGEGGGAFASFTDGLRPLSVDASLVDADRDGLALAAEETAATSDWSRDTDSDFLVDGLDPSPLSADPAMAPPNNAGASTEVLQMSFLRGTPSVGTDQPEGAMYCERRSIGDPASWACVTEAGPIVAQGMLGPVSTSRSGGIFGPDGDVFRQDDPPRRVMRWSSTAGEMEEFATITPDATRFVSFVALSPSAVLGVQTGPASGYGTLVRYVEGRAPFIVIDPDRHDCWIAGSPDDLAACEGASDPIGRRLRSELARPNPEPSVRFEAAGRAADGAGLFLVFSGSLRSFLIAVDTDGVSFVMDGMDVAGTSAWTAPDGHWALTEGTILDASLRPFADYSQSVPLSQDWSVGDWFGRGFMTGRFELVAIPDALEPGEVVYWSDHEGWSLARITVEGAGAVWLDRPAFEALVGSAGAASLEAEPLGGLEALAASPGGDRICGVERDSGRVWELTMASGIPTGVALVADEVGAWACAYSAAGQLAWVSPQTLHIPSGDVNLVLEGVQRPTTLMRVDDAWLVGDLDTSARCFLDDGDPITQPFQVALSAMPRDDVAVWLDPLGRLFADRAANLCTYDYEPEPLCSGAPFCEGDEVEMCCGSEGTLELRGFSVREDGVIVWDGWRLRPPYRDSLPHSQDWYRPPLSEDFEVQTLYTSLGGAQLGTPGGATALPGGTFPADYAVAGEPDGKITTAPVAETAPGGAGDAIGGAQAEPGSEPAPGDSGGCACSAGGDGGHGATVWFAMVGLVLLLRARRECCVALLAALVGGGCPADGASAGSSDAAGLDATGSRQDPVLSLEGTPPVGGSGPSNAEPLFPMRPGLRMVDSQGDDLVISAVDGGHRAVTSRGVFGRSEHGWGVVDPLFLRTDHPDTQDPVYAGEAAGAMLDVPDTVKVGMTWTSGELDFEVIGRQEGVATPIGPRTLWTIRARGKDVEFAEGIGPIRLGQTFIGAYIPLEDQAYERPPSPVMSLEPITGAEELLGEALFFEALGDDLGLSVTITSRGWSYDQLEIFPWKLVTTTTCIGIESTTLGTAPAVHRAHFDHNGVIVDVTAPIERTCHLRNTDTDGKPGTQNLVPEVSPKTMWIAPNGDVYWSTGFGMPNAFRPSNLTTGGADFGDGPLALQKRQTIGSLDLLGSYLDGTAPVVGLARFDPGLETPFTAPDLIEGFLPMFFEDGTGRTAWSRLDILGGEISRPVVGPTLVGTVIPRTSEGVRDLLFVATERDNVIDELRYDDDEAWIERVGIVDLPAHHRLVGVARMGPQDPAGLLVVTTRVSPKLTGVAPDLRRSWLWRAQLPEEQQPDAPAAPGLSVVARTSALDVQVCWAATPESLVTDVAQWTLAGAPAAAVIPVPGAPSCALILRDPSAWQGAAILEGPIPGAGRMLIAPEASLDPIVEATVVAGGAISAQSMLDELLLPAWHRMPWVGGKELGTQDATREGTWLMHSTSNSPGTDLYWSLLRQDGTYLDSELVVPKPVQGVVALQAMSHLLGGGVLVAGTTAMQFHAVRLDGTTTEHTFWGTTSGVALQNDGTLCGTGVASMLCQASDGTPSEYLIDWGAGGIGGAVQPLPDGSFFVDRAGGYMLFDVSTGGTEMVDGPRLARWLWTPDGILLAELTDHSWLQMTASGVLPFSPPATPADAGAVLDYLPTSLVDVVVTEQATFRFAR